VSIPLTPNEGILWGRVYACGLSIAEINGIPGKLVFDLASDFADQVILSVRANSETPGTANASSPKTEPGTPEVTKE